MEDVNVMPGIDFKANKEKIRNKKRKEKKINKILNGAIIIGSLIAIIGILFINKNMTDSALESCLNLGNNYNYCTSRL